MTLALLLALSLAQTPSCPMPGEESRHWLDLVRHDRHPWTEKACRTIARSLPKKSQEETTYKWDGDRLVEVIELLDGHAYRDAVLEYDGKGRLTSRTESYPVGHPERITFQYDSCGRLSGAKTSHPPDAEGEDELTYDELGRLKSLHSVNRGKHAYDYTLSFTYEGGRLTEWRQERDGKPASWARHSYDAKGRPATTTYGSGTVETFVYDDSGRQTFRKRRKSDGTMFDRSTTRYDDSAHTMEMDLEAPGKDGYPAKVTVYFQCLPPTDAAWRQ